KFRIISYNYWYIYLNSTSSPIEKEKSTKPSTIHESSDREFIANGNVEHLIYSLAFVILCVSASYL
ncbi:MAG: hypothetical protein M3Y53_02805, partial [Thermoproteota archaeon]|nr:hypothetical protein [Thermoproteota archaeon]